jgi:hypothetical protein
MSTSLPGSPLFAGGGSTFVRCAAATVNVATRARKTAFIAAGTSGKKVEKSMKQKKKEEETGCV